MDREKSNSMLLDEIFDRLIQFGNEADRPLFCQRLKIIWNEQGILCQSYPTITNQNLDLYKLHFLVQERNGYLEITANRGWKEISTILGFGDSGSAAYSVKRNYVRLGLLEYECRFDRVGLDPRSVIELAEMPHAVKKRKRTHQTASINCRPSNRITKHLKSTMFDEVLSPISKENSDEKSKFTVSNVQIDSNGPMNRILPEQILMIPDLDQLAYAIRTGGPSDSNRSIDAVLVYLSDLRTAPHFNLFASPIFLNVILEQYLACLFELFGSKFLNNSTNNDPYLDLFLRFPLRISPAVVGPTSNENRLKEFFFGYSTSSSTRPSSKEKIVNDDGSNQDNCSVNDKERHQRIISRCLCLATILRNLSFIDENLPLANDRRILDIFQRILMLEHDHFHEIYHDRISDDDDFLYLFTRPSNETRENDTEWCQYQHWIDLIDNTLVTMTNLATTIDLNQCGSSQIRFRLIKTLIHWISCSLSIGNEPLISMQNDNFFPSNEMVFVSIKQLSLQTLAKLATNPNNVDCILFDQSIDVVHQLADALLVILCQSSNDIDAEYCLSIVSSLCQRSDDLLEYFGSKKISIEFLLNYLELYEHYQQQYLIATLTSCYYVNINASFSLPINHSNDMRIESCVHLLLRFASIKNNKILRSFESRLVEMSSSIYFDQKILKKLSEILFLLSH